MCELVGGLMALGLMLAAFAAFGHAIWLMTAALLRALNIGIHDADDSVPLLLLPCPSCGRNVPPRDGRCPRCNEIIPLPPAELLAELEPAHRHIQRLWKAGRISNGAYGETVAALRRELSRAARLANRPAGQSRQAPAAELTGERVAGSVATGPDLAGASPPLSVAQTFLSESGPKQDAERGPCEVNPLEAAAERSPVAVVPGSAKVPEEILPAEAAVVTPPGRPGSRALADLLRAFMEEKNIRWGELLSGLLIVGSAVGLVMSLWASLRDAIPYFPALIFLLVTAAIHGAGMYTLRRWKLKSTSRALLVISTLLIPLNFLAAIALSEQRPVTDPLYLTAVGTGLFAFGIMAFVAGRVLLLSGAWLLPVAVLGTSAGQLLAARLARPGMSHRELALLTALPVVSYLIATCGQMVIAARWRHLTQRRAGQVLLLLGVSVFALLMPLGLIVVKSAALWPTLAQLAPWMSLAGFSIVVLGLVLQRRLIAPEVTALRTAATAVVLCGAAAMTISLVLAWPQAELLVLVGVIDCVVLSVLAVAGRFPALHVPAIEAVGLALLIGYHLAKGSVTAGGADGRELLAVLLMGRSGAVLTAFAVLVMSTAGLLRRAGRNADALAYLTGTGGLAAASTVIALYAGFGSGIDGALATPLLTFWAAVVLTIAYFARRSPITWAGSGLLLAACLHGVNLNPEVTRWLAGLSWHPAYPEVTSVLLHATLAALLALATRGRRLPETSAVADVVGADATAGGSRPEATARLRAGWILPLVHSSACISALAVLPVLGARGDTLGVHAAYGFWTAGLWLVYAALLTSPLWLGAFHCLAAFSVMLTVAFVCQRQPWWSNVGAPRHWHAQWAVLALWSAGWIAARRIAPGWRPLCDVWKKAPPVIEQTVLGICVAGFTALCTLGALPGISAELAVVSEAASQAAMLFLLVLTCGLCLGLLVTTSVAVAREQWLLTTLAATLLTVALAQPVWGRLAENFWTGAVDNHVQAYGTSAWLAGAGVLLALLAAGWARPSFGVSIGLVCTLLTVPLLVSARFETLHASASVLRWGMAGGLIATVLLMQLRDRMSLELSRTNLPERCPPHMMDTLGMAALVICLPALLALTLRFLVSVSVGITLAEPAAETLFARLGPVLSYAGPLCLLALTLAGLALRERSANYALAGSLAVNFTVSLTDILFRWSAGTAFGPEAVARYFQWNAIAFGAYAVAWLAVRSRLSPTRIATATAPADSAAENFVVLDQAAATAAENALWTQSWLPVPLQIQVGATVVTTALLAAWAAVATIVSPGNLSPAVQTLGTIHSYVAALLAAAALAWSRLAQGVPHRDCAVYFGATSAVPLGFFLSGSATFAAASLGDRNTAEIWKGRDLVSRQNAPAERGA